MYPFYISSNDTGIRVFALYIYRFEFYTCTLGGVCGEGIVEDVQPTGYRLLGVSISDLL